MTWWEGLPARSCVGPDGHTVTWSDGGLVLDAHPDPDAERALGALGATRCRCLDLLDAWDAHHVHGGILVTGPRHADDDIAAPEAAAGLLAADLARWRGVAESMVDDARTAGDANLGDRLGARLGPAATRAAERLGSLLVLTLDRDMLHRLQASVAATLAERDPASVRLSGRDGGASGHPFTSDRLVGHDRRHRRGSGTEGDAGRSHAAGRLARLGMGTRPRVGDPRPPGGGGRPGRGGPIGRGGRSGNWEV